MFKNVLLWSLSFLVIPNFRPFCSFSYGFWDLNWNFKINFSGQFWPDFCQKLISTSLMYTRCSYKILNCFIQPFGLHRGNNFVIKLLNLKPKHWWKFNLISPNNMWNRPGLLCWQQNFEIACGLCAHWCLALAPFLPKSLRFPLGMRN